MPWVFVDDVAEACVRALEVPEAVGQAFNLGHVETDDAADVRRGAGAGGGRRATASSRSRARAIAAAGGQLAGERLYFGEFLDLPPLRSVVEKAPRMLGVTPTPLEDALAATFAWYQTQPRRPQDYAFEDRLIARPAGDWQ